MGEWSHKACIPLEIVDLEVSILFRYCLVLVAGESGNSGSHAGTHLNTAILNFFMMHIMNYGEGNRLLSMYH